MLVFQCENEVYFLHYKGMKGGLTHFRFPCEIV